MTRAATQAERFDHDRDLRKHDSCDQRGPIVSRKLLLQANGMIVLETRGDRFVHTSAARDLRYRLQYKSTKGWWEITGWFEDELTARQMLREANPNICWRLVASNEHGAIALPNSWRGYCQ
jgi:hypothetical protein